jgi:uncharacterized protein
MEKIISVKKMVHTFDCLSRSYVLDTESGSIFEVTSLVKRLIDENLSLGNTSGDFLRSISQKKLDKQEEEALFEIEFLIKEGILFAEEKNTSRIKYGGEVKSLCLNISHGCNLRCQYCFADEGSYHTERQNMSEQVAKAAVDFLIAKSGNRKQLEIDFFGGEPLLNMEVVKATVAYARQREGESGKKIRFTITTNGVLLSDELIDYFNKEMYNVVISIDGRKDVHNAVRKDAKKQGSFDAAIENAKRFRAKRGDKLYYIRGTFTALNKDFAADVLALNDHGFDQISLEPVALPQNDPLALSEDDVPFLKNQYEILAEEYIKRRKTDKWFNFFHFMIDLKGGPCQKKRLTGCGVGSEYLCVSPDGGLYPCHRFDGNNDFRMGSVLDNTLDTNIQATFYNSNVLTKPDCKDCFCKYFCSGGCSANSIFFGGGIDNSYKLSCELMKKRTECSLAIFAAEQNQD